MRHISVIKFNRARMGISDRSHTSRVMGVTLVPTADLPGSDGDSDTRQTRPADLRLRCLVAHTRCTRLDEVGWTPAPLFAAQRTPSQVRTSCACARSHSRCSLTCTPLVRRPAFSPRRLSHLAPATTPPLPPSPVATCTRHEVGALLLTISPTRLAKMSRRIWRSSFESQCIRSTKSG